MNLKLIIESIENTIRHYVSALLTIIKHLTQSHTTNHVQYGISTASIKASASFVIKDKRQWFELGMV